jgi:hypothetical protein
VSVACKPNEVLLRGGCEPKPTNCPEGTFQPIAGAPCQTNRAGTDKTPSFTCNLNEMLVAGRCEPKLANCPNNTVRLASGVCKLLSPACTPEEITVGGHGEKPATCPSGQHPGPYDWRLRCAVLGSGLSEPVGIIAFKRRVADKRPAFRAHGTQKPRFRSPRSMNECDGE